MNLALPIAWGFLLVLLRTSALCMLVPIIGMPMVPPRVRIGVATALALVAFLGAGMPATPAPTGLFGLASSAAAETLIGLASGMCVRLVFEGALAAGSVSGLAMGLGFGAMVDPFNGASATVTGKLFSALALGAALALNLHGEAAVWLARSVIAQPPGTPLEVVPLAQAVISAGLYSTALAVRIAFPFLATGLMAYVVLGVIGRAVPQLNLSSIGFSVSLLAGGFTLYLAAPEAAAMAVRAATAFFTGG